MAASSSNMIPSRYVKGVFISRFDLSSGPTPITRYPAGFLAEAQANQLAMQSMIQLNTTKGKTAGIVITMDEIEAIGFGTLGSLPALGYYSFIVFFSIRAPKLVSDKIDEIVDFLAGFNAKLADSCNPDDSFAKEIFAETCRLLDLDSGQSAQEGTLISEQDNLIMKIVGAMKPVVEMDLKTIEALDIPLAHNLKVLLDRLNLVATSLNLPYSSTSLRDLLFEIQRTEGLSQPATE
ncbi:MAG: hypothetical protein WED04_11130 [Promethearchaeati archaeon SRVP18_Atabeyarchaeia-1]